MMMDGWMDDDDRGVGDVFVFGSPTLPDSRDASDYYYYCYYYYHNYYHNYYYYCCHYHYYYQTWPELSSQMRKVLKTDMDASRGLYEAMKEDLFTCPALVCGPDSPIKDQLLRVLSKQRGENKVQGMGVGA